MGPGSQLESRSQLPLASSVRGFCSFLSFIGCELSIILVAVRTCTCTRFLLCTAALVRDVGGMRRISYGTSSWSRDKGIASRGPRCVLSSRNVLSWMVLLVSLCAHNRDRGPRGGGFYVGLTPRTLHKLSTHAWMVVRHLGGLALSQVPWPRASPDPVLPT